MANAFVLYVCPIVGNMLGVIMLLSPTTAVLKIRKQGKLGVGIVPTCILQRSRAMAKPQLVMLLGMEQHGAPAARFMRSS
jgi:hypothetical protein